MRCEQCEKEISSGIWEPYIQKTLCVQCAYDGTPADSPTGTEARVCEDIAKRQRLGLGRYGAAVETNDPLVEWLSRAYNETLDKAIYLRRAIEEMEKQPEHQKEDKAAHLIRCARCKSLDLGIIGEFVPVVECKACGYQAQEFEAEDNVKPDEPRNSNPGR